MSKAYKASALESLLVPGASWTIENVKGTIVHIPDGVPSRSAPSPFVAYHIAIAVGTSRADGEGAPRPQERHLLSKRRFREFSELRDALFQSESRFMRSLPASFPGKTLLRRSSVSTKTVRKREEVLFHWLRTLLGLQDGNKWQQKLELRKAAEAVRVRTCRWLVEGLVDPSEQHSTGKLSRRKSSFIKEAHNCESKTPPPGSQSLSSAAAASSSLQERRAKRLADAQRQRDIWDSESKARRVNVAELERKLSESSSAVLLSGLDVFKFSNRRRSLVGTLKQRRSIWIEASAGADGNVAFTVHWCKIPRAKNQGAGAGGQDRIEVGAGGGEGIVWNDRGKSTRFSIVASSRALNLEALDISELTNFVGAFERLQYEYPQMVEFLDAVECLEQAQGKLPVEWAASVVALQKEKVGGVDTKRVAEERVWAAIMAVRDGRKRCRVLQRKMLERRTTLSEGEAAALRTRVARAAGAVAGVGTERGGSGSDVEEPEVMSIVQGLRVVAGDQEAESLRQALARRGVAEQPVGPKSPN
eukprot:g4541.t1